MKGQDGVQILAGSPGCFRPRRLPRKQRQGNTDLVPRIEHEDGIPVNGSSGPLRDPIPATTYAHLPVRSVEQPF